MMRLRALRLCVGFLVFAVAAPVLAEESPLAQVPASASIVYYQRGLERTKERLLTMVKNAAPDWEPQLKAMIDDTLDDAFEGRDLSILPKDGAILLAVMDLESLENRVPNMAVIARVTKYADFRDKFLKKEERASLKKEAGLEVVTLDNGKTLYLADRNDYVVLSLHKDSAAAFLKKQPTLDGKFDKETAAKMLEKDLALYVDMAAVNKQFGDQIKAARQGMEAILEQAAEAASKPNEKKTLQMVKFFYGGLFQVMDDSRVLLVSADIRPQGVALQTQLRVAEGSKSQVFLKNAQTTTWKDLDALPAGQLAYFGMTFDPELVKALLPFMQGIADFGAANKEQTAAIVQMMEAGPQSYWTGIQMPPQGLFLWKFKDPAKAADAQLKYYQAMDPEAAMLKEKPQIKENAQTHRDFKFHHIGIRWDLEKMAKDAPGMDQVMGKIFGEGMNLWIGTDGKTNVQIAAKDWENAKRQLDQYLDGKASAGRQEAFAEARKNMPEQATMVLFMDMPQYLQLIGDAMLSAIRAQGLPVNIQLPKFEAGKSYVGMSFSLQPKGGSMDLWVPGSSVAEVRKMVDAVRKGVDEN